MYSICHIFHESWASKYMSNSQIWHYSLGLHCPTVHDTAVPPPTTRRSSKCCLLPASGLSFSVDRLFCFKAPPSPCVPLCTSCHVLVLTWPSWSHQAMTGVPVLTGLKAEVRNLTHCSPQAVAAKRWHCPRQTHTRLVTLMSVCPEFGQFDWWQKPGQDKILVGWLQVCKMYKIS